MPVNKVGILNQAIVDNIHRIRALDFDVVVHCPRSGTFPASLIATYLCKPLASVEEYARGIISFRKSVDSGRSDRILLVDDSISTGKQIKGFIKAIKDARPETEIKTLCCINHPEQRDFEPDLFLLKEESPFYIWPWFMWKTYRIKSCAVDMDGVLCRDCKREEDDEGEKYLNFMQNAELKFKPLEHEIGAIVTARLEKYRPQTEDWLKRNGIRYKTLIMGPWKNNEKRRGNQAQFKADVYQSPAFKLFIESNKNEASEIARISGKPVWCVDSSELF